MHGLGTRKLEALWRTRTADPLLTIARQAGNEGQTREVADTKIPHTGEIRRESKVASEATFGAPQPLLAIVVKARWPWQSAPAEARFFVGGGDEPRELAWATTPELPESARRVREYGGDGATRDASGRIAVVAR